MHQFSGWLLRLLRRTNIVPESRIVIRHIFALIRHNGLPYTTSYLKESVRITYHWMAGNPVHKCEPGPFVGISKFGLPILIKPLYMRFIKGDKIAMQFTLFLLSWYRIFEIPGKLKLESITDPGVYNQGPVAKEAYQALEDAKEYSNIFLEGLQLPSIKAAWPFFGSTKTPSGLPAFLSIPTSIRAFTLNEENREVFANMLYLLWKTRSYLLFFLLFTFYRFMIGYSYIHDYLCDIIDRTNFKALDKGIVYTLFIGWKRADLGKLAEKLEAAGKIRVFAMVDPITQWVLKPFHLQLFKILEQFQWDGTKDQIGKAQAFSRKYVGKPMYSLDISSATDRIPMEFYSALFIPLWGEQVFNAWKHTLIGRKYLYRDRSRDAEEPERYLSYGAGQPMGALSSWASLAVIHHFIVKLAAWRIGLSSFNDYIILGDDLVIVGEKVAKSYLGLMKDIGVDINLSKSLISEVGVMEFAKRIWYNGEIFSAIPPRDAFLAFRHPVMFPTFIRGLARDVVFLPASHSIKFFIEHFGVNYDPYRSLISLPKALLGGLVELIGYKSIYANLYTPFLLLSLQRSRLIDLERWFQGKAHFLVPDLLAFQLLDKGVYKDHLKDFVPPLSWARNFLVSVRGSGIRISVLESLILIFWGLLIEIPDIIKYWRMHKAELSQSLPSEAARNHLGSQAAGGYAGNIRDSFHINTEPLLGRQIDLPMHAFGADLRYFVYTLDPLSRSPLSKISMDWTIQSDSDLRDAYKGARAKARFIRSLGRPYLQLPAI